MIKTKLFEQKEDKVMEVLLDTKTKINNVMKEIQTELDKDRDYVSVLSITDEDTLDYLIDDYLQDYDQKGEFIQWYIECVKKLRKTHSKDNIFLVNYIKGNRMYFVFQDNEDTDISLKFTY